ncbi:MAG: hypothetical protein WAU70_02000 [Flavobacteriales bacterium]
MSQQNPFHIIRPTDEPPEQLRREVLGSVRFVILMMRFTQLFVADFAEVLFSKIRLVDPSSGSSPGRAGKKNDPIE